MNVFNPNNLRNKQRFPVAIAVGLVTSIVCAYIIGAIVTGTGWYLSILYLGAGWAIGSAIRYCGRGVDIKFSILSVVCFVICVFLADFFSWMNAFGFFSLSYLSFSIQDTLRSLTDFANMGVIRTLMIAYAGYISYYTAKII
ncbi:hypothetical protein [Breznakia pachnodae]|uniref:Uncharacterized protein n=1 Tax=Breznakia pachnodae TaxID=265178 RepID=A0ABU0DYB3_9FIRM|nr:hypothetical protein [Breznakia pachnodae]MDQ0359494.1 hypothetical protein [Breznakia pachnodae]